MDKKMFATGGKKQKIFLLGGLFLAVVLLSGCGQQKKQEVPAPSASSQTADPNKADGTSATEPAALPETVSTQPGKNVDDEVKNIDNDLKSIDDNSLTSGMSDKDLGM